MNTVTRPHTRQFVRATIAFLFGILIAQTGLSHEAESHLRHWESVSPDPDRIFLSFHGDPATSRAVTWRTDTTVDNARAQIALATSHPKFDSAAREVAVKTETLNLKIDPNNKQGKVKYHSAIFDDLNPNTLYAYRVGDGADHWSEWIQFHTASTDLDPFSFVYFGDAQNDILSKWSRVIRMAYQKAPEASLAIHAGDLVNAGHMDTEWAEWFKAGGWIHSQWTGIPALGNHELRPLSNDKADKKKILSLLWRPQFTLPEVDGLPEVLQETVYTVDYQGVRFIVLNSMEEVDAQTPYLRKQLERPGARWTVLVSHYSIFTLKADRSAEGRKKWKPLLDEFAVDLVLQGHDHGYARGQVPVRSIDGSYGDTFQTMYVTSVSGPKQYDISPNVFEGYAEDGYRNDINETHKQFFQVIEVDGDKLSYKAYTADGELYDQAVIEKDPATGIKTLK